MERFYLLRKAFQRLIKENSLENDTVEVRVKSLTPLEAIGRPEHQDYPLIKGKEKMMEAELLGSRGQAFTDLYGNYSGTLREVAAMDLNNNYRRAVFLAVMNAAARHLGIVQNTVHCKDDKPPQCAAELASYIKTKFGKPKIALVGFQPRIAQVLAKEFEIRITDMDWENIGVRKFGIRIGGPERTERNLAWCDVALVTGSTLTNDSIRELVMENNIIYYGVTIAAAAHFLNLKRFCPCGT